MFQKMATTNFQKNLRLLCSYSRSIADACNRLGINRQQFHRYLNGTSRPSLRNIQKICDFFGVEESEILLDHEAFSRLIAMRRPRGPEVDPFGDFIAKLVRINPNASNDMSGYLGYYYSYLRPVEFSGKILRSLVQVFDQDGFVYVKTIENYSAATRRKRKILKHTGIAIHTGERILIHEREVTAGQMIWTTMLHPSESDQASVLTGLTLGVSSGMERDIACYRVVWEALGHSIEIRSSLQRCGLFDVNKGTIASDIVRGTSNSIEPGEDAFVYRLWKM